MLPDKIEIQADKYAVMTLYRPSNIDQKDVFEPIIAFLTEEVDEDI